MTKARRPLHRSEIMSRIRGRDTVPEMLVRAALRSRGVRYRLQARDLAGSPDIVMRGRGLAIFVHGCFWHRHEGCRRCTTPKTNQDFWLAKFERNVCRDRDSIQRLQQEGWRVEVIWECEATKPELLASFADRISLMMTRGRRIRRKPHSSVRGCRQRLSQPLLRERHDAGSI